MFHKKKNLNSYQELLKATAYLFLWEKGIFSGTRILQNSEFLISKIIISIKPFFIMLYF